MISKPKMQKVLDALDESEHNYGMNVSYITDIYLRELSLTLSERQLINVAMDHLARTLKLYAKGS